MQSVDEHLNSKHCVCQFNVQPGAQRSSSWSTWHLHWDMGRHKRKQYSEAAITTALENRMGTAGLHPAAGRANGRELKIQHTMERQGDLIPPGKALQSWMGRQLDH